MARILVRDLDESTVEALKARAKANNRSLQGEVKAILDEIAKQAQRTELFRETVEKRMAYWKAQGKTFSDSAEIIRELRDKLWRLAVDASVAVKWALPEQHGEAALRLATAAFQLVAPELLWVEVVGALRKRLRRGDLSLAGFRESLGDVEAWNIEPEAVRPLLRPAADLALHLDHGVYDCVYLALAERDRCQLVTADRHLHDKVERSPFAGLTLWIEDVP